MLKERKRMTEREREREIIQRVETECLKVHLYNRHIFCLVWLVLLPILKKNN